MDLKKLQNLPNTKIMKFANSIRIFRGYSPFPVYILLYLTYRCNLKCDFCPQYNRGRSNIVKSYPEMNLSELKNFVDNLIRDKFFINPRIHFFGGEPLLRKDFLEIIKYVDEKDIKFSLTTNGILLKKFAEGLVENNAKYINVSIDGPELIHDKNRGVQGTFKKALMGINKVVYFKQKNKKNNPKITVNCTINASNYNHLEETIYTLQNSGIDSLTFQHLRFYKDKLYDAKGIDIDYLTKEIVKIKKSRYQIPITFFPGIKVKDITPYYRDLSYRFYNKCLRPWLVSTIMPNGDVVACSASEVFGNIKTQPLKLIWNNGAYRAFRNKINSQGISHENCIRCCHRQYY